MCNEGPQPGPQGWGRVGEASLLSEQGPVRHLDRHPGGDNRALNCSAGGLSIPVHAHLRPESPSGYVASLPWVDLCVRSGLVGCSACTPPLWQCCCTS